MFKDYYNILGILSDANIDEIKKAYRSQSMRWHPDKNPGVDTTAKMQDINEAYNILKDSVTRARYDAEYTQFNSIRFEQPKSAKSETDYDIKDETLKQDIKEAQKAAEDYVREFYSSLRKDSEKAVRGAKDAVKGYLIALPLLALVGFIFMLALNNEEKSNESLPTKQPKAEVPNAAHWREHTLFDAFSISIPVTMEKQTQGSPYVKQKVYNNDIENVIIFNQKGLGNMDSKALEQYCRIMIGYYEDEEGELLGRDEMEHFDLDYYYMMDEVVDAEIGPIAKLIGVPSYEWVRINNANAIMITYKRTGADFDATIPVCCKILLFQDNDRMVKMVLAYREKEADLWKDDFEQVMRSFKWINKKSL